MIVATAPSARSHASVIAGVHESPPISLIAAIMHSATAVYIGLVTPRPACRRPNACRVVVSHSASSRCSTTEATALRNISAWALVSRPNMARTVG